MGKQSSERIQMLEADGWTVTITKRGRIRATHPDATGVLYGATTPSDINSIHALRRDATKLLRKDPTPMPTLPPVFEPVTWSNGRVSEFLVTDKHTVKCVACDWVASTKQGAHLHEMIHDGRHAENIAYANQRRRETAASARAERQAETQRVTEAAKTGGVVTTPLPLVGPAAEPVVKPTAEPVAEAIKALVRHLGVDVDTERVLELQAEIVELQNKLAATELRLEAIRDVMGQEL